ncbi:ATP-dependent Clp protease proteolytic subunit [Candidatus Saccharibacteria bacterium]|nr:ATP-dependent Clp protease proteolytic subunit [Candidatus Saccharibacteria bacterium]
MSRVIPEDMMRINCDIEEYQNLKDREERRLYLTREIMSLDYDENNYYEFNSWVGQIILDILEYNREDEGKPIAERKPIKLYINSPGGEIVEGFPLISTIELSKTPVYTINIGQWSSMSFLIGITGHKRFALPYTTFLLHDGSTVNYGTTSKALDKAKFDGRFEQEVVKPHVLKHSNMTSAEYDGLLRVEYYMLPQDAKSHHFIDHIIDDIKDLL